MIVNHSLTHRTCLRKHGEYLNCMHKNKTQHKLLLVLLFPFYLARHLCISSIHTPKSSNERRNDCQTQTHTSKHICANMENIAIFLIYVTHESKNITHPLKLTKAFVKPSCLSSMYNILGCPFVSIATISTTY